MRNTRELRAKLNIAVSLAGVVVAAVCGIIVPRLLLRGFGSEAYGVTASITQMLSYITLLEAGIGGVARAALYTPLARRDMAKISGIMAEIRRFFRIVGLIFLPYVLFLAILYPQITDESILSAASAFLLVIAISVSTFAQYWIGIANAILLNADQKNYIAAAVSIAASILNALLVYVLVRLNCSLVLVKLGSSVVFALKPVVFWIYVRRHYRLDAHAERDAAALSQKWTGLGQHIAFFLHSNVDIVVLTFFSDYVSVAVYSVYHLIAMGLQSLATAFSAGLEALLGDMLARREYDTLRQTFSYYETLTSIVSITLFSAAIALAIPFVRLYTAGVENADYEQPVFAALLFLACLLYCLRLPYHTVIVAAGHFAETKFAAYGEAAVNICLSIALVIRFDLIGVAIGTLAATAYGFAFYAVYLSKRILVLPPGAFGKRALVNTAGLAGSIALGRALVSCFSISGYPEWICCGGAVFIADASAMLCLYAIFYREDLTAIIRRIGRRGRPSAKG